MQPHKIMLSILMFIFFIVGGIFFLVGNPSDSNDGIFDNYSDISANAAAFNRTKFSNIEGGKSSAEAMYNVSSQMKEDVEGTESLSTVEYPLSLTGAFKALKDSTLLFTLFGTIVGDVFKILHIPNWAYSFVIISFLVVIAFIILYMVFRFQPRSN